MLCELTNKMINIVSYTFDGKVDPCMESDSYSLAGVIVNFIMFAIVFMFILWWMIPIRWAGAFDEKFTCDKKK